MRGEHTDYTRSHHHPGAQAWVGRVGIHLFSWKCLNTGLHEKVRCPYSRLAALHGAPRTHMYLDVCLAYEYV